VFHLPNTQSLTEDGVVNCLRWLRYYSSWVTWLPPALLSSSNKHWIHSTAGLSISQQGSLCLLVPILIYIWIGPSISQG